MKNQNNRKVQTVNFLDDQARAYFEGFHKLVNKLIKEHVKIDGELTPQVINDRNISVVILNDGNVPTHLKNENNISYSIDFAIYENDRMVCEPVNYSMATN